MKDGFCNLIDWIGMLVLVVLAGVAMLLWVVCGAPVAVVGMALLYLLDDRMERGNHNG